jgi:hypothetical protein
MNLRDLILNIKDIKIIPYEVKEWTDADGKPITIYLKDLSVTEAGEITYLEGDVSKLVELFIRIVTDESGNRLFTAEDTPRLCEKNAVVVTDVVSYFNNRSFPKLDKDKLKKS